MPPITEAHLGATIDPARYRRALAAILANLDDLNGQAESDLIDLFAEIRRDVAAHVVDLAGTPTRPMYERTIAGIDDTMRRLAERWQISLDTLQAAGFDIGETLATEPLVAGGMDATLATSAGVTTDLANVLRQFSADLVQGATADLRRRINAEIVAGVVGAKTPQDVAMAIGRNLTDPNHFRTILNRARAITVTELGRAQALGTQAAQQRLAADLGEDEVRKRWLNAHLPGARESHIAAESRYSPEGSIGPIPIDAQFVVAGRAALYPRDPSLPASESVNCHCVSLTVLVDQADPLAGGGRADLDDALPIDEPDDRVRRPDR